MIEVRVAKSNQEFIDLYNDYLLTYQLETQLFVLNLKDINQELQPNNIRGGVYVDHKLALIFLNANPFNLLLLGINNCKEANAALVDYIVNNGVEIKGILTNQLDAEQFINEYHKCHAGKLEIDVKMDIMKLDVLQPIKLTGKITLATKDHAVSLITFYQSFCVDALAEVTSFENATKTIIRMIEAQRLYVHSDAEGNLTGMIACSRRMKDAEALSCVYTTDSYRNKGHAASMVYQLCKLLLENDDYVVLFVDQDNPISNHVYEKVGFKIVTDMYDYKLKK